jgi:hypothetical protein
MLDVNNDDVGRGTLLPDSDSSLSGPKSVSRLGMLNGTNHRTFKSYLVEIGLLDWTG